MPYLSAGSFISLFFCLCLGMACSTRKIKPPEPLVVKRDIIPCRYPERMTTAYQDTIVTVKKSVSPAKK